MTSAIHDRMPVILDPDSYALWLDPRMNDASELSALLKPYDARLTWCYPVSTRINYVAKDDEECSAPVELAQVQNRLFSKLWQRFQKATSIHSLRPVPELHTDCAMQYLNCFPASTLTPPSPAHTSAVRDASSDLHTGESVIEFRIVKPEDASELEAFLAGSDDGETNFQLWLARKMNRKCRALERKANRLLNCAVTARPMDCLDCGLKGYVRFYCGNRYCRYCGNQVFVRLFAKYIRLQEIVQRLMCRDGFRPSAVLATFTFTTANLGRMPTAEEIRQFNRDVRVTLRLVCKRLEINASQFGVLWCDEFGGWNPKLQDFNTNLHCHGIWLGPFLPLKLVSAIWSEVRGMVITASWLSPFRLTMACRILHAL